MRKFWLFAVLVVVVLALVACGGGAATPAPAKATEAPKPADTTMKGDAVAGKKLYATACVACLSLIPISAPTRPY